MSILILIFILWLIYKMEKEDPVTTGETTFWVLAFLVALGVVFVLVACTGFIF